MNNAIAKLTADIIIELSDGRIVLIKRAKEPYMNDWALPGGKMEMDEEIEITAVREAKEETGLLVQLVKLIGVYSKPNRDPRGRYISVAYLAKAIGGELLAQSDAKEVIATHDYHKLELAFDHKTILEDYRKLTNS
jgi:8-oxo-dGTP diphosphatase